MANEIQLSLRGTVNKSTYKADLITQQTVKLDQTNVGGGVLWLDVGTSEETLSFGDGAPGFVVLKNHDATNFVTWGYSTGQLGGKLRAGGGLAIIELASGASLILKADTAACKVEARYANA